MDELTREIQNEIPWNMLFADDIVLIDEYMEGVNTLWRSTLESQDFRFSGSKTKYLHCRFSVGGGGLEDEVAIGGAAILKVARFRYLSSIVQ